MLVEVSPQLQALLQDRLPQARYLESINNSHKDLHEDSPLTVTDYLEYVDKTTGFTPLLAAVFYHKERCARLVRDAGISQCQCILQTRAHSDSQQKSWHACKPVDMLTS